MRFPAARLCAGASRVDDIGRTGISFATRVGLSPTIEFAASTAGTIARGATFRADGLKTLSGGASWRHEEVGPLNADTRDLVESRHRYWFHAGSFARKSEIQPAIDELDALNQVQARGADRRIGAVSSSSTPYVSLIWSLVGSQQLRKARALLKLVPDSPEYARLRRLLSAPVASVSRRTDFDRSAEYRWLAENAKNYVGMWVAISGDSLLGAAKTLKDLREEVKKTGPARAALLHYVE